MRVAGLYCSYGVLERRGRYERTVYDETLYAKLECYASRLLQGDPKPCTLNVILATVLVGCSWPRGLTIRPSTHPVIVTIRDDGNFIKASPSMCIYIYTYEFRA